MIKTITDPKIFQVVSGGFPCECWTSDVQFAFDRMTSSYSTEAEKECRSDCCAGSKSLPRLFVNSYKFNGAWHVCGEDSPGPILKAGLEILAAWGLADTHSR